MTKNRKQRRALRKITKNLVLQVRPNARFLTWADFRRRNPAIAEELCNAATCNGYDWRDVIVYEHSGLLAAMYPPTVAS